MFLLQTGYKSEPHNTMCANISKDCIQHSTIPTASKARFIIWSNSIDKKTSSDISWTGHGHLIDICKYWPPVYLRSVWAKWQINQMHLVVKQICIFDLHGGQLWWTQPQPEAKKRRVWLSGWMLWPETCQMHQVNPAIPFSKLMLHKLTWP